MGRDNADSSATFGSNVGPAWGLRRLLWVHSHNESIANWRFAGHGSLQLRKEKVQIRETDQGSRLLVFMHLCEVLTAERSARSEAAKEYHPAKNDYRFLGCGFNILGIN